MGAVALRLAPLAPSYAKASAVRQVLRPERMLSCGVGLAPPGGPASFCFARDGAKRSLC